MINNRGHQQVQNNLVDSRENNSNSSPATLAYKNSNNDAEYKGDRMKDKRSNIFRLGFININSIPEESNDPKNDNIRETINLCEFDILVLQKLIEVGTKSR